MESRGLVIAVLPAQTTSRDAQESLLAHGLLADVTSELTRFSTLQVIAWTSGTAVAHLTDREAGERLGATHILRSRVGRSGDRLRVAATLVESAGCTQLWSESYDASVEHIAGLQEELVARIASTLSARLEQTALMEARRKPPESLAGYELVLRGLALLRQGTPQADAEARDLFRRALELDPHYSRAYSGLSLSYFNEWSCQFWDKFQEHGRLAYQHAHRALELDDSDAMLHIVIGRIHLYHRDFEQASWYFDRAFALCPNDADNLMELSVCQVYLGRPEVGREYAGRAMRLNPYHPNSYYCYASLPYFMERRFERALELGARVVGVPMVDIPAYKAVALAYLGRLDEAREQLAAYDREFRRRITLGREPEPGESVRWLLEINPYRRTEDADMILEGFRLLGEPGARNTRPEHGEAVGAGQRGRSALVRQGASWVVEFAGRRAILPDLKGIHDIRRLLEYPGEEFHCLDLAERGSETDDGDDVLDGKARQELRSRIRDLQEELAEAEDLGDTGRAEAAREELDRLIEILARALGLQGRSRRLGSAAEKARSTVTWRMRHAVRKIQRHHETLGRHLSNSLRTGTFCSYRPEHPLLWRF